MNYSYSAWRGLDEKDAAEVEARKAVVRAEGMLTAPLRELKAYLKEERARKAAAKPKAEAPPKVVRVQGVPRPRLRRRPPKLIEEMLKAHGELSTDGTEPVPIDDLMRAIGMDPRDANCRKRTNAMLAYIAETRGVVLPVRRGTPGRRRSAQPLDIEGRTDAGQGPGGSTAEAELV